MSHPHHYQRHTAPKAYLKREFIESRPRQITIAGMIGSYRISVLDLTEHYDSLKQGLAEPIITAAILNDRGGIHGIRGTVKHYILVIDDTPVALFDTEGRYLHEAEDDQLSASRGDARISGSRQTLQIK